MSNEIKTGYNGYPIDYDESNEIFRAFVDGNVAFKSPSLKALKEQIDKFEKSQKRTDFRRFKIFVTKHAGWNSNLPADKFSEAEVTSITEGGDYWITSEGKREKVSTILPITENNKDITAKIDANKLESSRLYKELQELEKSLDRLTGGARPQE